VRTSATAVLTSVSANQARFGNDGAGHSGLVFEEARTNLIPTARNLTGTGWATGSGVTTTTGITGVDGASGATQSDVLSGGWSNYMLLSSVLTQGDQYTYSQWVRNTTGTGPIQAYVEYGGTVVVGGEPAGSNLFHRLQLTGVAGGTAFVAYPADGYDDTAYGGLTSGARNNVTDLIQLEAGAFATEAIVTNGSTATRAAEDLTVTNGESFVDNGRVAIEVVLQPKGARNGYPTWGESIWTSGSDWAAIEPSTGQMTISIGGSSNVANFTPAISWNALDTVEIFVAAGGSVPTVVEYRVNGGEPHVATISGSALGSVTASGALEVLCYHGGFQFSSYVRRIRAWSNGQRPAWAR
jgi:hypothetical protein